MQEFRKSRSDAKLSEMVQDELEQAILSGKLKVNQQLPTLLDLCESFGVSRTVVREAMQRLQAEGLVECRMGSGSYVSAYPVAQVQTALARFAALNSDPQTLLQLLDLRMVLEAETCARMAQTRDPQSIHDIRLIWQRMQQTRDNLAEFAQFDHEFHLKIAQAAGNPLFPTILDALSRVGQAFATATYQSADVVERTCCDHMQIIDAIAAGDVERSRQAMISHLTFTRTHALALFARAESRPAT